jgi:hypothetical protein
VLRNPFTLTLALAVLLGATSAVAASDPVRLQYSAPEGCPGLSALRARVAKRLKNGRLARPGELARVFRIHIDVAPEHAVAHMNFTDADGREATRELSAPTCREALNAIALVAALAIEARAKKEAAAHASRPVAPPPRPPGVPHVRRAEPPTNPTAPPRAEPEPASRRSTLRAGEGALLGVDSGFAPVPALELSVLAELRFGSTLFQGWLAYANSGPSDADGVTATYRLYTLGVEACPVAVKAGSWLALRPCAGLNAGVVHAAGERGARVVTPNSATPPWVSALALGRLEVAPDPRLIVLLQGGAGFPLTPHRRFILNQPSGAAQPVTVYTVPYFTWQLGAGLLARFE